jgi:Flp pilus assembly pilin Flp
MRRKRGMHGHFMCLWQNEQGQDLTEYALLFALIALVVATSMQNVGTAVMKEFNNASSVISTSAT